jgi:hypothetical protein
MPLYNATTFNLFGYMAQKLYTCFVPFIQLSTSELICFPIWLQYQNTDPCNETVEVFSY